MTTTYLAQDISVEEGLELDAYPDPLSGGDPWTIGFGCTGPGIKQGVSWTMDQACAARDAKIADTEAFLDKATPWWRQLSDVRQDVLVQMGYQLGVGGMLGFHRFLSDLQDALSSDNYAPAAFEMGNSRWAKQTTGREKRMATQLLTNTRQPVGS